MARQFIRSISVLALLAGVIVPAAAEQATRIAMLEPVSLLPQDAIVSEAQRMHAGRPIVAMPANLPAGAIMVVNKERRLYLSLGGGDAISYPVAIGKPGRAFSGDTHISRKVTNPTWTPTPNIRREKPDLPAVVAAGPNNPLGPRAMYLGASYYRIHGTNKPESIGKAASHGCIRMLNKDVVHLFALVDVGARVVIR